MVNPNGNPQYLKPNPFSGERAKLLGKFGGKSRSQAKKEAAKWREIKKRIKNGTLKTKDEYWLLERLENSKAFSAEMLAYYDEIKETIHPNQRVALLNTLINIYKAVYGEKLRTEALNINVNMDIVEWEKRLYGDKNVDNEEKKII